MKVNRPGGARPVDTRIGQVTAAQETRLPDRGMRNALLIRDRARDAHAVRTGACWRSAMKRSNTSASMW